MAKGSVTYKVISLFIKLVIVGASLYYIYYKIVERSDFTTVGVELKSTLSTINVGYLSVLLVLMILNWSLEALKWKMLIDPLEPVSFPLALKAVLAGITVSVFTPNRTGEFGGRIFFLEKADRIRAVFLTFIGNAAQLLVTIVAGAIALLFYLPAYTAINSRQNPYLFFSLLIFILLMAITLVISYFNISLLTKLTGRIKMLSRIQLHLDVLEEYSFSKLFKLVFLSLLRYSVFTLQFFLLLKLFHVDVNVKDGLIMIMLTFFAITAIPTISFTELGVRGSAALAFIGLLSTNSLGIVCASFSLWLINIALPAVAGTIFVFQLKFFKNRS